MICNLFRYSFELTRDSENYAQYVSLLPGVTDEQRRDGAPVRYYQHQADRVLRDEATTMHIDFAHLSSFNHADPRFMPMVVTKFHQYERDLVSALTKFMDKQAGGAAGMLNAGVNNKQKPLYQVAIFNLPQMSKIRQLRTTGLGRLSAISGTVTRTTDSKPELLIGCFECGECKAIIDNVEQ